MIHTSETKLQPHASDGWSRYPWLTGERQAQLRAILLGLALFVGLVVWVWHSFGATEPESSRFVRKLRIVGIMTWLYALLQIVDMRFWHSRFAERRRVSMGIPERVIAWLFGQMLACFGIVYYAFTEDLRWFVAGVAMLLVTFAVFPAPRAED
jgi:hypothetical protein